MTLWEKREPALIQFARQGWTMKNIAEHYGVSPGYVKVKMSHLDISLLRERAIGNKST